jgi:hypothetical protein
MNSSMHSKDKNHVGYVHHHLRGHSELGEKAWRYNGLFGTSTCRIGRSIKVDKIDID